MALGFRAKKGGADIAGIARLFLFHVVVAINHIQSVLVVKQREEPEYIVVNFNYLAHFSVFPELIPVPELDIRKTALVIMREGSEIQILIFQEIVVGISAASVAVADNRVAAARGYGQYGRAPEGAGKTGIIAHRGLLYLDVFLQFRHLQYLRGFSILRKAKGKRKYR